MTDTLVKGYAYLKVPMPLNFHCPSNVQVNLTEMRQFRLAICRPTNERGVSLLEEVKLNLITNHDQKKPNHDQLILL